MIEDETFAECSMLNIKIPSSINSIGHNAFTKCTSFRQIDIPHVHEIKKKYL